MTGLVLVVLVLLAAGIVAIGAAMFVVLRKVGAGVRPPAVPQPTPGEVQLAARESELARGQARLAEQQTRLAEQETRLAEQETRLTEQETRLAEQEAELAHQAAGLAEREQQLAELAAERRQVLERLSGLSADDARAELMAELEADAKRQAALRVREIESAARAEGEGLARDIVATVVQRVAAEQTADTVVSSVHLASEDLKGRIIGREGRNIRAFEQVTGVNLIVDDTPGVVVLSCFDPVRREVARMALEALVADGRIHPSRIEDVYQRSQAEVDRLCQRAARDALIQVGIDDLHPELVTTLGRLRYRTSYGQNVLSHLLESANLAGLIADELGVARAPCVRAAFLHDIGKALTHEAEGSHALVGADLARRCGESEDVVHAIEAHHNEVEPRTVEAVITQAADAISGGRPGARRESMDAYVKRVRRLEEIAGGLPGVDRVFSMQAGRELRVMVLPEEVDDIGAQVLARDIVKQIEHELTYPGQIKVVVIRESRAIETAK